MDTELRIQKTVKNLIFTWTGYFAVILSTFVGRKFFVMTIGMAFLGVNGLFTNIISCLNLVDLGLGTAITFSLYRPIEEHNEKKITAILCVFHKIYVVVGVVVGLVGVSLTPFLAFLINDIPAGISLSQIKLYYVLFVINNAAGYFLYYKAVLINADQKQYLVELNYSICMILMTAVQIIILLVTKNYLFYLVVQIVFTIIKNITISCIANKRYPYIREKSASHLTKKEVHKLTKGVGGMMFQKIGTVIVNSTDNIIISKFVNLVIVGVYSNYYSIINALNMVLNQIFKSALSSVGNFNITASKNEMSSVFEKSLFVNFWIHGFVSISLIVMFNPLIRIWLGDEYLLSQWVIVVLGVNFYLNGMRQTSLMFSDALGLYWENRYKPIFEALVNLILSLILVRFWGILGVFLGTTCSIVFVCLWAEPYIVFKHALHISLVHYFKLYIRYLLLVVVAGVLTYMVAQLILVEGFQGFVLGCVICLLLPNALFFMACRKSESFLFFYDFAKSMLKKK